MNVTIADKQTRTGEHFFISVDSKKKDFVVYNMTSFQLTDEEIISDDLIPLTFKEPTPVIQQLKSEAWSCNCTWFFVMQEEGIYLFNVYDNNFWLCKKHSKQFIEMYFKVSK